MRPFGKFYSAHHSAHVKWRVATHSDHSCCERVSERPQCCNLICLSCEVKAFIISARAIRCHLHWTWHVHVLLQPWDSCTGESRGRRGWKMKEDGDGTKMNRQLTEKPRSARFGSAVGVKVIGPVGGRVRRWKEMTEGPACFTQAPCEDNCQTTIHMSAQHKLLQPLHPSALQGRLNDHRATFLQTSIHLSQRTNWWEVHTWHVCSDSKNGDKCDVEMNTYCTLGRNGQCKEIQTFPVAACF